MGKSAGGGEARLTWAKSSFESKDDNDDNDNGVNQDESDNETCMEELPLLPFVSTTRFGWTGVEPTRVPLITMVMMRRRMMIVTMTWIWFRSIHDAATNGE